MKAPDFNHKCDRCDQVVRWNGSSCFIGSYAKSHKNKKGELCLPPPVKPFTSITIPVLAKPFPKIDWFNMGED